MQWREGAARLRFSSPKEVSGAGGDGSPFLAACLLQAMRRGEDLRIDAPVSPRLLAAAEEVQTIYRSWAPSLRRAEVTAENGSLPRNPPPGFGCFFSRGVDSMFSAAAERPERFTHLVFIADLDPINDDGTRAEEIRQARAAAELLGKPLVVAGTNLRRMADRVVDWADLLGAGLSAVGMCLDGGIGRVLIPAGSNWATLGPSGSNPVLDHLFSTESLAVEHAGMGLDRHEKVAWLAERRPELLPYLKVCYRENRPDNCGRCRKCLRTMVALEAAGALERASGFPSEIDVRLIRDMRLPDLTLRLFWLHTAEALHSAGRLPEVRDAIYHALRRSAKPALRERLRARWARSRGRPPEHDANVSRSNILFFRNQTNAALAVLRTGRPEP